MFKLDSLTGPRAWISPQDPAIDPDHADYDPQAYLKDDDERHLPLRVGQNPTRFTFEPLTREAYMLAQRQIDAEDFGGAATTAITFGLSGVDDFSAPGPWDGFKRTSKRVTPATLDRLFQAGGADLIVGLGLAIFRRSKPHPTSG